jgi:hypothetical protein
MAVTQGKNDLGGTSTFVTSETPFGQIAPAIASRMTDEEQIAYQHFADYFRELAGSSPITNLQAWLNQIADCKEFTFCLHTSRYSPALAGQLLCSLPSQRNEAVGASAKTELGSGHSGLPFGTVFVYFRDKAPRLVCGRRTSLPFTP